MSDTLPTTTADAPLLELRGLTKHFPLTQGVLLRRTVGQVQAVDGVSMTLGPGETLGLVGESGSGKSTVAKLIMALQQPTAAELGDYLPDLADGLHTQLSELHARPCADKADRLAVNLEGARLHVLRLRERLVNEGEGHGGR